MISIKSPKEIAIMAEGGKILAKIMKELEKIVQPGIITKELEGFAENLIFKYGGKCSFKGYEKYPACLCVSVNEEIVHVVPSGRVLKEGDIVSLDLGIYWKGFHTDMARTLPVGKISFEAQRLIKVTKKALKIGIKKVRVGAKMGEISNTIQKYVESQGYNVVRELCGHGIGRAIHEEPKILNYLPQPLPATLREGKTSLLGKRSTGPEIKEGMVFCLEPMVTKGHWKLEKIKDGFGYKTKDNSLSCHFEDTVAVIKNGIQVLTKSE